MDYKDSIGQGSLGVTLNIIINGSRWYTYKQLARKLGVSNQTIFNRAKAGRLLKISEDGCTFYREVEGGR